MMLSKPFVLLVAVVLVTALSAQEPTHPPLVARLDDPAGPPAVQLPSAYEDPQIRYFTPETERAWIATLPPTDDPVLARLLARPLIPYSHEVLPRISQDYNEVWNGEYNRSATQHDPNPGAGAIGVTTRDPQWRHTAGVSEGTRVMHFLSLPDSGSIQVWRQHARPFRLANASGLLVYAQFPVGTVFLEAIYTKIDGGDVCCELRTRTKVSDGYGVEHWRPNRYVPARDAQEYAQAVAAAGGDTRDLAARLGKDRYRRQAFALDFPRFEQTALRREGYTIPIPPQPASVTRQLLRTTPFRSTLGHDWETFEDGLKCAAPTADQPNQIYPVGYQGAFFPTSMKSCRNCHEDDGKNASDLGPGDWYGVTQTYDNILSWTPIAPVYGGLPVPPQIDPRIARSPRVKRTNW